MSKNIHAQRILILDFGSQFTQLIARRVREAGVYCEIHPFDISDDDLRAFGARGIIIDAGYSVRVVITGEPVGERYVDINFTEAPSLDYWVKGQLVEERVYSNVGEALKRIRAALPRYLIAHTES